MLDVTLSILALIAGGVTLELFTAAKAQLDNRELEGGTCSESLAMAEDLQSVNPS